MEVLNTKTNKTIVVSYDDTTRMSDFCNDTEGNISKEYYDWYLKTEDYFTTHGILLIDNVGQTKVTFAIEFDFTNPELTEFTVYNYADWSIICKFKFKRTDNIAFDNIVCDIKIFHNEKYIQMGAVLSPAGLDKVEKKYMSQIKETINRNGYRKPSNRTIIEDKRKTFMGIFRNYFSRFVVHTVYSMMYYVSKIQPEEITTSFIKELNAETEKVAGIYKYSGYIDLRENKVYRPIIKRDPDSPIREYNRHIQAWSVRGHYRKTKNGLIWINEQVRGKGELEKRVYSTVDEKELNITPKVFEVERSKVVNIVTERPIRTESEKPIHVKSEFVAKPLSVLANFKNVISRIYKWVINT